MLLAFVGDVHGCTSHALAALLVLQHDRDVQLEAVIQVGDFGAHPTPPTNDSDAWYLEHNPAQTDVFRTFNPDPTRRASLDAARRALCDRPILVISGNHEDDAWLADLHLQAGSPFVDLDPAGMFRHVTSGTIMTIGDLRVAFLGGIAAPGFPFDFDAGALEQLMDLEPGSIDVLVTHDGPYGMCLGWDGRVQGSRRLTRLIEHLQPRLHVSGHYHHQNGPRTYSSTTSYALAALVDPKTNRFSGEPINPRQHVTKGSIGILDTRSFAFEYLRDPWLENISGDDLDIASIVDHYRPN